MVALKSGIELSSEIRRLVEERIDKTIRGVEETLQSVLSREGVTPEDLKRLIEDLEPSFSTLSQKWVLEILYSLLLRGPLGFNELKRATGASSKSLSMKLKLLERDGLVQRRVMLGPPIKTAYELTEKGRGVALLAIPLLYYLAFGCGETGQE